MKVTCEINDYSNPAKPCIRVHNASFAYGDHVELEVEGKRYEVNGEELISAVERCLLNCMGR